MPISKKVVATTKKRVKRAPVEGSRVGTKRSDRRWLSPSGEEFDSKLEYYVYDTFDKSTACRRTTKGDSLAYTSPVRNGSCVSCGGTNVGQQRHYTPDLFVVSGDNKHQAIGYYVEVKGYLRPRERSLFRSIYKTHKDVDLRFLFATDFRAAGTKGSITMWFKKFCPNWKLAIWHHEVPKEWK
jgi:hypothetical protein